MTPIVKNLLLQPPAGIVKDGLVAWYDFVQNVDAQTLWNKQLTTMYVTNLLVNSNFTNATGWTCVGGTGSVTNNVYNLACDGSSLNPNMIGGNNAGTIPNSNKVYLCGYVTPPVGCTSYNLNLRDTTVGLNLSAKQNTSPTAGVKTFNSGIVTLTAESTYPRIQVVTVFPDAATANTKIISVEKFKMINLTALFGAGFEPTAAQCDILFAGWFDGTVSRELPLYNGTLGSTTGSDTNDPTWVAGGGLSFDGGDWVDCGNGTDVNITGPFTLISIQKPSASAQTYPRLVNKESAYGILLGSQGGTGTLDHLRFYGTIGGSVLDVELSQYGVIIPNTTQFTAIVYNGSKIVPYINGNQAGAGVAASGAVTTNSTTLKIGNRADAIRGLIGNMYTAMVYNRALTDAEIKRNYKAVKKELVKRGVAVA